MKKLLFTILIGMLLLSSCSNDDKKETTKVKSITKIQEEQGIPVKVQKITESSLVKWKDYSGTLEGTNQSLVFANLGDNIDSLLVEIGDRVVKDQVVAKFSTSNLQAQYKQAEIQYITVEKTYNRMKKIYEAGGISLQKLDEIEAQYNVSKANFNTTKELILIKTPISGVVVDMFVERGQKIGTKDPVCKIAKISKLKTTIFVDESDINKLNINDKVNISWDGLKGEEFTGKIAKISISAEPRLRGFAVEISIDNRSNLLKPGTFVDVKIKTLELNNIISISRETIIEKSDKKFVYLISKDKANTNTVKLTEIKTGLFSGNMVEIKSGIKLEDNLVIEGQTLLEAGIKVKIIQ